MFNTIADTFYAHGAPPVAAMTDSIELLHVGSTSKDDRLVLEGRKRCLFAINSLRLDVSQPKSKMGLAGVLLVSLGIMMTEVNTPILEHSIMKKALN